MEQKNAPTLVPTHSCFDDAIDWFTEVAPLLRDVPAAEVRVCHGVCKGHENGENFAHAWVVCRLITSLHLQRVPVAWQAATLDGERVWFTLPEPEFLRMWQVRSYSQWTPQEAAGWVQLTGITGPWDRELVDLCNRGNAGRVVGRMTGCAPLFILPVGRKK